MRAWFLVAWSVFGRTSKRSSCDFLLVQPVAASGTNKAELNKLRDQSYTCECIWDASADRSHDALHCVNGPLILVVSSVILWCFQTERNDNDGCPAIIYQLIVKSGSRHWHHSVNSTSDFPISVLRPNTTYSVSVSSLTKNFTTLPYREFLLRNKLMFLTVVTGFNSTAANYQIAKEI